MTDRTSRALKSATRAAVWMAALGALNVLVYGRQLATGFWPQLAVLIGVPVFTFLLLGSTFFALAYADESELAEGLRPGRWIRPFGKTRTFIAYLVAGWLAALLIVGIGNYLVGHRAPTSQELGLAMFLALILGPVIGLIAAFFVARLRRIKREFGRDEQNST